VSTSDQLWVGTMFGGFELVLFDLSFLKEPPIPILIL